MSTALAGDCQEQGTEMRPSQLFQYSFGRSRIELNRLRADVCACDEQEEGKALSGQVANANSERGSEERAGVEDCLRKMTRRHWENYSKKKND